MYDTLFSQINSYIRANSNNEITGTILNDVLGSLVDVVGAGMRFCGMAEPNTVPIVSEYPKFYVAFTPGVYTNFNIGTAQKFATGFAIIYDSAGNNTWAMAVKPFKPDDSGFLINAAVKNNTFGTDTGFYIKNAAKVNNTSTFDVFALNKDTSTELLVAAYAYQGLQSGYKTHELTTSQNTTLVVSVNWDVIAANESVDFTYEDSMFPSTAYADTSADLSLQKLTERLTTLEYTAGKYKIENDAFVRELMLGADFYVDQVMAPSFLNPSTYSDLVNNPRIGSTNITGYMNTSYFNEPKNLFVNLKLSNFPSKDIYHIYIPNTSNFDHTVYIQKVDANNNVISTSSGYTIHVNSVLDVCILRIENSLTYKVSEFLN